MGTLLAVLLGEALLRVAAALSGEGVGDLARTGEVPAPPVTGDCHLQRELARGKAYRLVAELAPYPRLGRAQAIEVRYGSEVIAVWHPPDAQWRTWTAEVPAALPTGSVDEVQFTFGAAARPSDEGASADTRRLAVLFRTIRFEPTER